VIRAPRCITIIPAPRRLAALLVVLTCAGVLLQPPANAASRASPAGGQHALVVGAAESKQQLLRELAGSVREFRRSVDQTVGQPANPYFRINFTGQRALLSSLIGLVRQAGGLARQANTAQLVVLQESRRVRAAWEQVDRPAEVAAAVQQLESLAADAARASGARTDEEINAFKKAHLGDIRQAGQRWLVDHAVGRNGAKYIARGARNPRLRNAIEQLYRYRATIGDGGTADALLAEVRAGCRTSACTHFIKAVGYRKNLTNIRRQESLSAAEVGITDELIGALTKAIKAAGGG
jgi:hypothetical protein